MVRLVPTFDDMKFESAIDDAYKKGYADGSLAVTEEILAHKDKEIRAKVYEEVIERIDLGVCQFCCGGCDEGCDTFELSALQKWLQIKLDELKKGNTEYHIALYNNSVEMKGQTLVLFLFSLYG